MAKEDESSTEAVEHLRLPDAEAVERTRVLWRERRRLEGGATDAEVNPLAVLVAAIAAFVASGAY